MVVAVGKGWLDWKPSCNTDAGSSPRCGKGFFSQSQLSVQTFLQCPHSPVCAVACINFRVRVENPKQRQQYTIVWTRRNTAHTDRNG